MSPKSYDGTHENILQSAKKFFLEFGYEKTNLRELCKDAEITTGAFYRHFKDKDDLFSALVKPTLEKDFWHMIYFRCQNFLHVS